MTRFSQDVNYFNLTYFEFVGQQATAWLAPIEELPMTHARRKSVSGRQPNRRAECPFRLEHSVAHIRMAIESGRMFYVDLSGMPENERPGVIAEIKALVERAAVRAEGRVRTLRGHPPKSAISKSTVILTRRRD